MSFDPKIILWLVVALATVPMLRLVFRALTIEVDEGEAVLVTRFGRHHDTLKQAGLHTYPSRALPWIGLHRVSLRRQFRKLAGIHINDARGTTLMVDLWLELRVVDPERALYSVADWDRALVSLVTHATSSILGNRELRAILRDRHELSVLLQADILQETSRWGLQIELAFISKIALRPDVASQLLESVAAQLERAKAAIDEDGRLRIAELEADTQMRVAGLVAEAKAAYPTAIGAALGRVGQRPTVLTAYNELYALSQVRPHRTVAFRGFGEELTSVEAAMMIAPGTNGVGAEPDPS